jgi:hypothetical protein
MDDFRLFLLDLTRNWVGLLSGGVGVALQIWQLAKPLTPKIFRYVSFLCFFVAVYMAWLIQKERADSLQKQIATLSGPQLDCNLGGVLATYDVRNKVPMVMMVLDVANHGSESVVRVNGVTATLPDGRKIDGQYVRPEASPYSWIKLREPSGKVRTFWMRDNFITESDAKSIEHNGAISGWTFWAFRGPWSGSLPPKSTLEVRIFDINGKMTPCKAVLASGPSSYYDEGSSDSPSLRN